jgi:hypothetical protein
MFHCASAAMRMDACNPAASPWLEDAQMTQPQIQPTYARFVPTMAAHGYGRSFSFELARKGLVKTFKVGSATFVDLESVRTLPERIAAREKAAA